MFLLQFLVLSRSTNSSFFSPGGVSPLSEIQSPKLVDSETHLSESRYRLGLAATQVWPRSAVRYPTRGGSAGAWVRCSNHNGPNPPCYFDVGHSIKAPAIHFAESISPRPETGRVTHWDARSEASEATPIDALRNSYRRIDAASSSLACHLEAQGED